MSFSDTSSNADRAAAVSKALGLAAEALELCDQHGLLPAGIDLSSAIEKLKREQKRLV